MARFRFKLIDSQGRRRSGVLRAPDRAAAERELLAKLCQIEELSELEETTPQRQTENKLSSSFPGGRSVHLGLSLVAVCLLAASFLLPLGTSSPTHATELQEESLELRVLGSIDTSKSELSDSELDALVLLAVFPELPYEVGHSWTLGGSDFDLAVDILAASRPTKMHFEASTGQHRWRLEHDFAVADAGAVRVGTIQVKRPLKAETPASSPAPRSRIRSTTPDTQRRLKDLSKPEIKRLMRRGR